MTVLKKFWRKFLDLLGLHRNSDYVEDYIRSANVRSAVFMAGIVLVIEIWMICRQFNKYLIPGWESGSLEPGLPTVFNYISNFILFFTVCTAILAYTIPRVFLHLSRKTTFIVNLICSGIALLYSFFIFAEKFKAYDTTPHILANVLVITLYVLSGLLALAILGQSFLRFFTGKDHVALTNAVIVLFAAMCVAFGIKVSYSDFISASWATGHKEIICFLTMILYSACLLIWRPIVSIVINTVLFVGFYILIVNADVPFWFAFKDGDRVNYITFFISLSMVAMTLYHQRRSEGIKTESLAYLAEYDEVTDLPNFTSFAKTVALENEGDGILLFVNIASFRLVNDRLGFEGGNDFLKRFGHELKEAFPDVPFCRQGDDHFLVYAKEASYMDQIRDLTARARSLDKELSPKIRVGVYRLKVGEAVPSAVDKARYACSLLKNDLRHHIHEYDDTMDEGYTLLQYIIHSIDDAVAGKWIKPYYQPVVSAKNGKLCGVEALARWEDPERGFLSPGDFIHALETTKLIYKLDACILDSVLSDIRLSLDRGEEVLPCSINFSRTDFETLDIVALLDAMLAKYDVDKSLIHIEITESALVEKESTLLEATKRLKAAGYALWLDDFGSGYSSLNTLKEYDFDVLKIDMAFLRGFEDPKTKSLLRSIILLAKGLGMETVTEGVEAEEQVAFLTEAGCDKFQGFLFGKPLPYQTIRENINLGKMLISYE